jgi:hypothetical protein
LVNSNQVDFSMGFLELIDIFCLKQFHKYE